ncbi:hypothetical protein VIGAN_03150100 [Vigna angularis var. angularis]|nr:hypothetical protein VIGAN_03150100 [Vigna angularis var. angularis]
MSAAYAAFLCCHYHARLLYWNVALFFLPASVQSYWTVIQGCCCHASRNSRDTLPSSSLRRKIYQAKDKKPRACFPKEVPKPNVEWEKILHILLKGRELLHLTWSPFSLLIDGMQAVILISSPKWLLLDA